MNKAKPSLPSFLGVTPDNAAFASPDPVRVRDFGITCAREIATDDLTDPMVVLSQSPNHGRLPPPRAPHARSSYSRALASCPALRDSLPLVDSAPPRFLLTLTRDCQAFLASCQRTNHSSQRTPPTATLAGGSTVRSGSSAGNRWVRFHWD